jgi:hypothetical protein
MAESKISAVISAATKAKVERYADAHRVKISHLVEEALLYHLQALAALPADLVVPPRIVLTAEAYQQVVALTASPRKPTKALRDLVAGRSVADDF